MEASALTAGSEQPSEISLLDARAAGAPPTWTEAVALLREICAQLLRQPELDVPDLSQILVLSTGSVVVTGGHPHRGGQVAGLGALMGQLIEPAGVPPPLLEVERQAQATPPAFASVRALHAALEYFARPDPGGELAAYFSRAAAAIQEAEKTQAFELLKEKTRAAAGVVERTPQKKRPPIRRVYWVLLAALVVAAVAVAAYLRYADQAGSVMSGSTETALAVLDTATRQVTDATTAAIAKMIGGVPAGEEPANTPAPAPAAPTPPASSRARATPSATTPPPPSNPPPSPAAEAPPESPGPPAAEPDPMLEVMLSPEVYSAVNAEVAAPVLMYPQLPTNARESSSPGARGELELLVLEDGTVGAARLIPASKRVQDGMLVSAAKTWRFRPASRNGQPVKYRIRMPITW